MTRVILRFYEELNEYLPPQKRKRDFEAWFSGWSTVGKMIEQQRIPEGEVDLVLVNGQSVDFNHVLKDGDRLSVYPVFERLDVTTATNLRGRPLRTLRFVAEKNLGGVAERLRELGFDALDAPDLDPESAMDVSVGERRILLTTDENILRSGTVTHGIYVAAGEVEDQLRRIMEELHLNTDGAAAEAFRSQETGYEG